MSHWFYEFFWVQQDYLWFLVGVGWLTVAALWWQGRDREELPEWTAWSAAAGIAIAAIQVLIVVKPGILVPNEPVSLASDVSLGVVLALQAAGWWVSALRGQRGRIVLVTIIGAVPVLAAAWRYNNPSEGMVIILLSQAGAAAWWLFAREGLHAAWRRALVVVTLATIMITNGPVALLIGQELRWVELSRLGPWSAIAQLAAVATIIGIRQRHRQDRPAEPDDSRAARWFYAGVAGWLVLGLLFAIAAGEKGRRDFERSAIGRVRTAAALLPRENVTALLDDRFQVTEVQWHTYASGFRIPSYSSEHVASHRAPVERELTVIAQANQDVPFVTVDTLRMGWLISVAVDERSPAIPEKVTLLRRATDEDDLDWMERRTRASPPVMMTPGETVFARAPLVSSEDEMLGWLSFVFPVSNWIAAQAQPRSLAYLAIAFGLIIGRQLLLQRNRVRERDRAQAQACRATEASRLKTTFLANVSHELRTPLQTIMGYTDMLLPGAASRDQDRLRAIRDHADLMGRLVNDLIDLSAAETGNFHLIERPVALVDQVIDAAESLRDKADAKGLAFNVSASPGIPPWLLADPQRVRQVALNLVSNAIKYTDYGMVDVELRLVGRHPTYVEVELRVSDTGPGIDPRAQTGLFEAFSRLDLTADREGTGLGLAIVAAVCKAMKGSVSVESDGQSGSRFMARWHMAIVESPAPAPSSSVPLRSRKILVADDNPLVRDLFVSFLTECGAICASATDGIEAIRRLRGESFDAVVLDLAMPRLDGMGTVRQLRREMPDRRWRIVGVSAHASGTERDEALAAGMDAFLVKPVALPELARALAPEIGWVPPARPFDQMRARFEQRFRADATAQRDSVARAWEGGQWKEIHAAAHYLKNSADVIGDEDLSRACAELEAAARARDQDAGAEAWRHCRLALSRWVADPATN